MKPDFVRRMSVRSDQVTTHCGRHMVAWSRDGTIEPERHGYFFNQTRFLSRFELRYEGKRLKAAGIASVAPHATVTHYLMPTPSGRTAAPPGDDDPSGGEIVAKGIEIQINAYVGGGVHVDAHVTNHALSEATVALDWTIDADFADINELASGAREISAPVRRTFVAKDGRQGELAFGYEHPRLNHATRLSIRCGGGALADCGNSLRTTVRLKPHETDFIAIDVAPVFMGELSEPWFGVDGEPTGGYEAQDLRRKWLTDCAEFECSNPQVEAAWKRAATDLWSLQALEGAGEENFTPVAGIPKYTGLFGRDSLVAGIQSAFLNPATLQGSLISVGAWNATAADARYDAEPGRVLHQRRVGPLALTGRTPLAHYYGDYSAPAYFLIGAAAHFARTGDKRAFDEIRDQACATLRWMERDADIDDDGFYEYRTRAGTSGIKNQGWKDSRQAILYPDGAFVKNPIAVADVQGLFYAAKQSLAAAFLSMGESDTAEVLFSEAADLKKRFNERFWMPEEQFFALALDPDKKQVKTIASNIGLCLATGVVDDEKARAVANRLIAPDMFSGWGVRTLSSDHPAYNPLSYHLGSVWPVSSAHLCVGLKRYGFVAALHKVAKALFDATALFDGDRLPELFGGHPRGRRYPHPGIYPDACSPQAWSASAVIQICHMLAGVFVVEPLRAIVLDPALPDWLPQATIRNLVVGDDRVSIALRRGDGGETACEVLEGGRGLRICRVDSAGEGADRFALALHKASAARTPGACSR